MSATVPGTPFSATPPHDAGALAWYYAGFWWRVLAWFIDAMALSVVNWLFGLATGLRQLGLSTTPSDSGAVSNVAYSSGMSVAMPSFHVVGGGLTLLTILVNLAYYSLFEASRLQATPGKLACRLRVADEAGRRIGLGRAVGRNLAKFVSALTAGVGFLMVAWTRRKQGLHDLIASTLVLRRRPADLLFGFQPPAA